MELSSNCTVFLAGVKGDAPSAAEIQMKLESPQDGLKAQGMQELITGRLQLLDLGFTVQRMAFLGLKILVLVYI